MLYYDAKSKKVVAYDGRETTPAAATTATWRARMTNPDSPPPVPSARRSNRSIGVPGVMRMLDMAHKEHGVLAWSGPV